MKYLVGILMMIAVCVLAFLIISACLYGICWAIGYPFTWRLAVAVFLVMELTRYAFGKKR